MSSLVKGTGRDAVPVDITTNKTMTNAAMDKRADAQAEAFEKAAAVRTGVGQSGKGVGGFGMPAASVK